MGDAERPGMGQRVSKARLLTGVPHGLMLNMSSRIIFTRAPKCRNYLK
ncbi:hypothetical protein GCM10007418_13710 [Halopseudomonas salina]|uniref:Uncharacterized protein n=1 Tax=Halopseudomonas salina TaxID=1323744 RepID=A0ABQ1PE75_9GAMM|nr:hypothetical protein GCM10007418_13710 [Halopseudomonas salina]